VGYIDPIIAQKYKNGANFKKKSEKEAENHEKRAKRMESAACHYETSPAVGRRLMPGV
jgi:hypothetical protein